MQDESNSAEEFSLPEEWCKKQHRQLAIRYNIIPKDVKKSKFYTESKNEFVSNPF